MSEAETLFCFNHLGDKAKGPHPVFFYDVTEEEITIKLLHPSRKRTYMIIVVSSRRIDNVEMWTHEFVELALGYLILDELELNHPEKLRKEEGLIVLPHILDKDGYVHPIHHVMSALITESGIKDMMFRPDEYAERMPWHPGRYL